MISYGQNIKKSHQFPMDAHDHVFMPCCVMVKWGRQNKNTSVRESQLNNPEPSSDIGTLDWDGPCGTVRES